MMPGAKQILLVEDEGTLLLVLKKIISKMGYRVEVAETVTEAKSLLGTKEYFAAFLDIRLPDGNGLELLSYTTNKMSACFCVVMTAEATMNNAIKAVKKGAFEYLVKPFDLKEIEQVIRRMEQRSVVAAYKDSSDTALFKEAGEYEIIGQSPAMQKLYEKIGRAAASDYTALITGDSGTGKELVARNLHEFSDRAGKPFVTVNCSAIPKELMESELFGYVKGAFTGADSDRKGLVEEADGGVLFMDEIGETSPGMQAKILRLLEEGKITPLGNRKPLPVNVRFIAATNRNLEKMVAEGGFREDLYHRLNVIQILIPPLKKRPGDVELLAKYIVKKFGGGKRISDEACGELAKRLWPGNVRQLQNVIKRALAMSPDEMLLPSHFKAAVDEAPGELEGWIARQLRKKAGGLYESVMGRIEAELIRQALEKCGGNKIKTSALLGINRNTLAKKAKAYKLEK